MVGGGFLVQITGYLAADQPLVPGFGQQVQLCRGGTGVLHGGRPKRGVQPGGIRHRQQQLGTSRALDTDGNCRFCQQGGGQGRGGLFRPVVAQQA